jgi:hypothetical protein
MLFGTYLPQGTYLFHVKVQFFVILKNGQEQEPEKWIRMDPHWFGSLYPDPDSSKKLNPYPH